MKEKESKPKKPLKVTVITGLNIGPKQLIEQQKIDVTLKRYWELVDRPKEDKPQFITKNGILYRKCEKCDVKRIQLMVPSELRGKVVSLSRYYQATEELQKLSEKYNKSFIGLAYITLLHDMLHHSIYVKEMFRRERSQKHQWGSYQ